MVSTKTYSIKEIARKNDDVNVKGIKSNIYVVFVANKTYRKKYKSVFKAFQIIKERGYNGKLAIVGSGWELDHVRPYVKDKVLEDVVLTGFVQEEEVSWLYRNAQLSVFPTLPETFGMPVLESMGCGCPVVSSNYTAVPEVAGDAALLAEDPLDEQEIADLMWRLLSDYELRQQKIKAGLERARQFTWTRAAREFVDVIEGVVS